MQVARFKVLACTSNGGLEKLASVKQQRSVFRASRDPVLRKHFPGPYSKCDIAILQVDAALDNNPLDRGASHFIYAQFYQRYRRKPRGIYV